MRRTLIVALLLSIVLHLGALVSPAWVSGDSLDTPGEALRLEAKLSAPPATVAAQTSALSKPRPQPKPHPKPAPLPADAPTAQLPAEPIAADEPIQPPASVSAPTSDQSMPGEPSVAAISGQSAPVASSSGPLEEGPSQTPVAQRLPRQGRVLYAGTAGGFIVIGASGQASWEHDGDRLQSRLSAGLLGPDTTLDFSSTSRLVGPQIISESTRDNRRGRISTGQIDQAAGKVTMQRGEDTRERPIKGLAVAISALPQLLATLDEKLEKAAFFIVGDFWVEDSVLIARGKETLNLPAGRVETRHYAARTRNGSVIEVWLAPAWRNAPARIRIELGSVVIDLKAAEVEIDGQILARAPAAPRGD